MKETIKAIVEASYCALSIVTIGVGRGPWQQMIEMDDNIPHRQFDNFQFVDYHSMMLKCENASIEFARRALMEIPLQYEFIKKHIL